MALAHLVFSALEEIQAIAGLRHKYLKTNKGDKVVVEQAQAPVKAELFVVRALSPTNDAVDRHIIVDL